MSREELIVGLDIGTTKTSAVILATGGPKPEIVSIGTCPSHGVRKGVVIDMEATVDSIRAAIREAERAGDCEVHYVYVGLVGCCVESRNELGILPIRGREVRGRDVKRVIDQAQTVAIPSDREVVHVIEQEYEIDGQEGILKPVGMSGVRLTGRVHIVTAQHGASQAVIKCCNKAGLHVVEVVAQPLASSEAVLTGDEQLPGVALVDIGGGTTDVAVFQQGAIRYTTVIALGGNHLTSDLVFGLRTSPEQAEDLKRRYGCAHPRLIPQQTDLISVPSVGDRPPLQLSRKSLAEILEPRVEEMLSHVRLKLEQADLLRAIPCGVVLTGGASALDGLPQLASEIFEAPVRRGVPRGVGGLGSGVQGPELATGVGLALWGSKRRAQTRLRVTEWPAFRKLGERVRGWLGSDLN